jgi:hypothetical protein
MRRKQSSESAKRREVRHGIRGDTVEGRGGSGGGSGGGTAGWAARVVDKTNAIHRSAMSCYRFI